MGLGGFVGFLGWPRIRQTEQTMKPKGILSAAAAIAASITTVHAADYVKGYNSIMRAAAKKRFADYDMFVAEAPMMPTVGRVAGPILGPRGKMPTPVPPQAPIDNILDRERRTIVLRSRDKPFMHCIIGKEGMSDDEVTQNIETVVNNLTAVTKRGFANIKTMYVKLTMGDSVKLV